MAKPYEQLDESVEKALVELAMTVVRQLFRREVKLEPSHVVGVVREAIQVLPDSARDVRVNQVEYSRRSFRFINQCQWLRPSEFNMFVIIKLKAFSNNIGLNWQFSTSAINQNH